MLRLNDFVPHLCMQMPQTNNIHKSKIALTMNFIEVHWEYVGAVHIDIFKQSKKKKAY